MAFITPQVAVITTDGSVQGFSTDERTLQSIIDNDMGDNDILVLQPDDYTLEDMNIPQNISVLLMPGARVTYADDYAEKPIGNRYENISGAVTNVVDLNLSDEWLLQGLTTDQITEGSKLFFTNGRVNDLIEAGTNLIKTYDGSTLRLDAPEAFEGWFISDATSGQGSLISESETVRFTTEGDPTLDTDYDSGTGRLNITHQSQGADDTNNSGSSFVQNITIDESGHVTDVTSTAVPPIEFSVGETELGSVPIDDQDVILIDEAPGSSLDVTFTPPSTPGGNIKTFTVDHNVSAGSSTSNSGQTFVQNITLDSNGHVSGIDSTEYVFSVGEDTTSLETMELGHAILLNDNDDPSLAVDFSTPQPSLKQFQIYHTVSGANDTSNSGRTVIQNITIDDHGHVTGTDSVNLPQLAFQVGQDTTALEQVEDGHFILVDANDDPTLEVTFEEPTIFGGSGKRFGIAHNVSAAGSVDGTGRDFIQDVTLDANGHVIGLETATANQLLVEVGETTSALSSLDDGDALTINEATDSSLNVTFTDTGTEKKFEIDHNVTAGSSTSNQTNPFGDNRRDYVKNITLDTNGHITNIESDSFFEYSIQIGEDTSSLEEVGNGDALSFKGDNNLSVSYGTNPMAPFINEITYSHSDSPASSSTNSGTTFIQSIEIDQYGHVTSIGTADEQSQLSFVVGETTNALQPINDGGAIVIKEASNSSLSVDFTVPAPFGGSIKQFEINHNVSAASDTSLTGNEFIQNLTFDQNGHVTGVSSSEFVNIFDIGDYFENPMDMVVFGILVPRDVTFTSGTATLESPSSGSDLDLNLIKNGSIVATITIPVGSTTSNSTGFPVSFTEGDRMKIETVGGNDGVGLYYNVKGEV